MNASHAAHVPPPKRRFSGSSAQRWTAAGAGVAAAVGLAWLLAPGFSAPKEEKTEDISAAKAPAPAPIAVPTQERPVAQAEVKAVQAVAKVAAVQKQAAREGGEYAREGGPAKPEWATRNIQQSWSWPRKLELQGDGITIERKLSAWFPNNPPNKQFQFSLIVDGKNETRLFEDEIPAFARKVQEDEEKRIQEERIAAQQAQAEKEANARRHAEFDRQDNERIALQRLQKGVDEYNANLKKNAPAAPKAAGGYRPTYGPKAGHAAPQIPVAAQLAAMPVAAAGGGVAGGAAAPIVGGGVALGGVGAGDPREMAVRLMNAAQNLRKGGEEARKEWDEILAEVRKQELAAMVAGSNGAIVSAKQVAVLNGRPIAELTMADGTKKLVPYDPLVFDLKGRGIKTGTRKVLFDLFGSGKRDKTQWMNDVDDGVGILVFNVKGDGKSGKNGAEVFGDRTDLEGLGRPSGYANGFAALRGLAEKAVAEGVLTRHAVEDDILDAADLAALEKAYGLKMKVGGLNKEAISLAKAGVSSIALSKAVPQRANDFDGQQNDLMMQQGAVFLRTDGTIGTYMNVWLSAKEGNLGLKTVKGFN